MGNGAAEIQILVIAGLGLASVLDWKYRRIPNWLTFTLVFLGFLFQTYYFGVHGFFQSLVGTVAGIALLYIPFQLGGMGGGDVKLLGAIGSFVGPQTVFLVFLASAIFGGIFSLAAIIQHRAFSSTWTSLKYRLLYVALRHRIPNESEVRFTSEPMHIPYALTMCAGYLVLMIWGGVT